MLTLSDTTTDPERLRLEYGQEVSDCYIMLNSCTVRNKYIPLAYSITDSLGITSRKKRNNARTEKVENAVKALDKRIDILNEDCVKSLIGVFSDRNRHKPLDIIGYVLNLKIILQAKQKWFHECAKESLERIAEHLKEYSNEKSYRQNKSLEEAIKIAKEGLPYSLFARYIIRQDSKKQ